MARYRIYEPEVYYKSAEEMDEVKDGSIQLLVTRLPDRGRRAFAKYEKKQDLEAYLSLVKKVGKACRRKLSPGGRMAIVVSDLGTEEYVPMHSYLSKQLIELGFLMKGTIYWDKGAYGPALGVPSPANPILRSAGEYILVLTRDSQKLRSRSDVSTISKSQYEEFTRTCWRIESKEGEQEEYSSFPDEVAYRLIQLYTHLGDTLLDPFLGSGTTCRVAKALGRRSIGYEVDSSCRNRIESNITNYQTVFDRLPTITLYPP